MPFDPLRPVLGVKIRRIFFVVVNIVIFLLGIFAPMTLFRHI